MDTKEIQVIKEVYRLNNAFELDAMVALFDPDVTRREPEDFPTPGLYRGRSELKTHFEKGRSTWAEGGCFPKEFKVNGNKIVVFLHIHVRLKGKTEWIDCMIADGFVFKDGLVTEMNSFSDDASALKWAGM